MEGLEGRGGGRGEGGEAVAVLWFVACGLWFVVCGLWIGVWGLGFGVWGLGFGVWGLGSGSHIFPIVGDEARVREEGGVPRHIVHL